MIRIFSTKNFNNYLTACELLESSGIEYSSRENYVANRDYMLYGIFINENDVEKSLELLKNTNDDKIYYYENIDLAGIGILILLFSLIVVVMWIKSL